MTRRSIQVHCVQYCHIQAPRHMKAVNSARSGPDFPYNNTRGLSTSSCFINLRVCVLCHYVHISITFQVMLTNCPTEVPDGLSFEYQITSNCISSTWRLRIFKDNVLKIFKSCGFVRLYSTQTNCSANPDFSIIMINVLGQNNHGTSRVSGGQ